MALVADIESHQAKRHSQSEVTELNGLHWLARKLSVVKHLSPPCKHGVALQIEVGDLVGIGVNVVFATTGYLRLISHQEIKYRGIVSKLGVNRQRLYRHAHRME